MSFEEYWIGKGINFDEIWAEFDSGDGYIRKFETGDSHLIRLGFDSHPTYLPLFDHEALYKTIKGTFHDLKQDCLTPQAYDQAGPLYLNRVERGSGIYEFLGDLGPALTYLTALAGSILAYQKVTMHGVQMRENNWEFIRSQFPQLGDEDLAAFMKAWTEWGRRRVLQRLIQQGLHRLEASKYPVKYADSSQPPEMVDVGKLVEENLGESDD